MSIIQIIPKDKKCRCGRKITNHHFFCNLCWKENQKSGNLINEHFRKLRNKIINPEITAKFLTSKKKKKQKSNKKNKIYTERYLQSIEKQKQQRKSKISRKKEKNEIK
jgi:hypothetical protein